MIPYLVTLGIVQSRREWSWRGPLFLLVCTLPLSACSRPIPPRPQGIEGTAKLTPVPAVFEDNLVVMVRKKGETLYSIAKTYTGSGKNWKKIAKLNDGMNPQTLQVGHKVIIPQSMLLAKFTGRVEKSDKKSKSTKTESAKPDALETHLEIAEAKPVRVPAVPEVSAPPGVIAEADISETNSTGANLRNRPKRSLETRRAQLKPVLSGSEEKPVSKKPPAKVVLPVKTVPETKSKPTAKKAALQGKQGAAKSARYRVISSSGYGSLNREVSRLDAELAKAEALAEKARTQPSDLVAKPTQAPERAAKSTFSCSKNKCTGQ